MGKMLHSLIAVSVALGLASCAKDEIGAARYGADQCRRVALIDADGALIRGAEDLALDRDGGRLFVSAYDRRAVEKAAKRNKAAPPSGGVYAIPLNALFDVQAEELKLTSLAAPGDLTGGLRPHGIHYDVANKELVFINRTYARAGRKWRMTPRLQRIGANGEVFVGEAKDTPCAANNVASAGGQVLTSFDHASCGFGAGLEDVFRLKRSGYSNADGAIFKKAAFANGITVLDDERVVLAATREKSLLVMIDGAVSNRIQLPGGPDNVTTTSDGGIIAALHPKMLKLAFNRKLGWGKAPSRIVRVDTQTNTVEIMFDDAKGTLFSAATAAVETPQGIVAGSVTDEGLLVCHNPARTNGE